MITLIVNIPFVLLLLHVPVLLSRLRDYQDLSATLIALFRLLPGYNVGNTLFYIIGFVPERLDCSPPLSPDLMQWEKCGVNICVLFVVGTICLPLLMVLDYLKNFPSVRAIVLKIPGMQDADVPEVVNYISDADVQAEALRVLSSPLPTGQPDDDVLVVRQLRKVYGRGAKAKVAVQGLTLGLKRGSCFGFLGINGAGKTTTLNILTGAQLPSSGEAWLGGKNILSQQDEVRRLIGYCPQHDALLEKLSVREHLVLFGRIKGVAGAELEEFVRTMVSSLDLAAHEHKLASTLSGGNKRKLSVGIALMGSPQLVFLDEPSTGVDPAARRFMWDMIARLSTQRQECTVVLTTHNMEEAEALCSVVGVMVGGRLRCLGSNQHLKARFGGGYQLEIKLTQPSEADVRQLVTSKSLPPTMTLAVVREMCAALGDASRAELVRDSCEEGYAMYEALQNGGQVTQPALLLEPALLLCRW